MSNPNKAKGTRWETEVKGYLNKVLSPRRRVYRPAQEGARDTGDLHGLDPFVGQAKAWRDIAGAVREGVAGAVRQAENAGMRYGVAFVKAERRPVGECYAVMRIADWADFLHEYLALQEYATSLRWRLDDKGKD